MTDADPPRPPDLAPSRSADGAPDPVAARGPAAEFTRATVLLIVGLLVFAAGSAVVILTR